MRERQFGDLSEHYMGTHYWREFNQEGSGNLGVSKERWNASSAWKREEMVLLSPPAIFYPSPKSISSVSSTSAWLFFHLG